MSETKICPVCDTKVETLSIEKATILKEFEEFAPAIESLNNKIYESDFCPTCGYDKNMPQEIINSYKNIFKRKIVNDDN